MIKKMKCKGRFEGLHGQSQQSSRNRYCQSASPSLSPTSLILPQLLAPQGLSVHSCLLGNEGSHPFSLSPARLGGLYLSHGHAPVGLRRPVDCPWLALQRGKGHPHPWWPLPAESMYKSAVVNFPPPSITYYKPFVKVNN